MNCNVNKMKINHFKLNCVASPQWDNAAKRGTRIIFMRGLPRSGKTTLAKQYEAVLKGWTRFTLDEYRLATYGTRYNVVGESHATAAMYTAIRVFLNNGLNIILDDTHSSAFSLRQVFLLDTKAQYITITPNTDCYNRLTPQGNKIPLRAMQRIHTQLVTINPETIRTQVINELCQN